LQETASNEHCASNPHRDLLGTRDPRSYRPGPDQSRQDNHTLMQQMELGTTPAILYLDDAALLRTEHGAPQPANMASTLGPR
jgi:hypothetical protein